MPRSFFHFVLLWLLASVPALGEPRLRFGPEFTFTNWDLMFDALAHGTDQTMSPAARRYRDALVDEIKKSCPQCEFEEVKGEPYRWSRSVRVVYPGGFWIHIGTDPGVVEVTARPSTTGQFKRQKKRMQRDIFDAASRASLKPSPILGGGHINIGMAEQFLPNPTLFRNVLVDLFNNPEINQRDRGSSRPIHTLPRSSRRRLREVLDAFDAEPTTAQDLALRIHDKVYVGLNRRDMAVALQNALATPNDKDTKKLRLELRGIPAQNSAQEFLDEIELIEKRIQHVSTLTAPIPLRLPGLRTRSKQRRRFRQWVENAGADWDKYRHLPILPPWYHPPNPFLPCLRALEHLGNHPK